MKLGYQKLLLEFQNALQQFNIHNKYIDEDSNSIFRQDRIIDTNFTGQGFYNKKSKITKSSHPKDIKRRCWNCSQLGCSVSQCPREKDQNRIRRNRIKFFEKLNGEKLDRGTEETLFEFCEQVVDHSESSGSESECEREENATDIEIQHTLATNRNCHIGNAEDEILGF